MFYVFRNQVQTMLTEARSQSTLINDDGSDEKPLIRLRVEYSDKDRLFDRRKLEFHVTKLVANNNDVVRFIRKRSSIPGNSDSNSAGFYDDDDDDDGGDNVYDFIDAIRAVVVSKRYHLQTMLLKHFDEANDRKRLSMLDEKFFIDKLETFTEKNQTDCFRDFTGNTKQAMRFLIGSGIGDNENFELDDLKKEIRSIKQKIVNDQDYRQRFEWIIREPFVKRPSSLLQQKLSNSSVMRKNQSSNNGNDSKNVDPFYDDDIDMFDVNQIDDNEEDDDDDDEKFIASTSRGRQNRREQQQQHTLKTSATFFDMENFDSNDDPKLTGKLPAKKKPKLTKTVAIEDSDDSDFGSIETSTKTINKGRGRGRGRGRPPTKR